MPGPGTASTSDGVQRCSVRGRWEFRRCRHSRWHGYTSASGSPSTVGGLQSLRPCPGGDSNRCKWAAVRSRAADWPASRGAVVAYSPGGALDLLYCQSCLGDRPSAGEPC